METTDRPWILLDQEERTSPEADSAAFAAETAEDALTISLAERNGVDPAYMGALLGREGEDVVLELRRKGLVCQDPDQWQEDPLGGWVLTGTYCSGVLYEKYHRAKRASRRWPGRFDHCIERLRAAMPKKVLEEREIYAPLGALWIPVNVYNEFRDHILARPYALDPPEKQVRREDGRWKARNTRLDSRPQAQYRWGTPRYPFTCVLEDAMNDVEREIKDTLPDGRQVRNVKETEAGRACLQRVKEEWARWLWSDASRSRMLRTSYHWAFCTIVNEVFDGSYIRCPGMAPGLEPYPFQRNCIARILRTRNVLLNLGVGSGKTVVMAAAIMELQRLNLLKGIALYVAPNHLVAQARAEFLRFYPGAKVLLVDGSTFPPAKRQGVLRSIREGGWDCVILSQEAFKAIPFSSTWQYRETESQLRELNSRPKSSKRRREALEKRLLELAAREKMEKGQLFFEDLGVRAIFVDEAHYYKKIPMEGAYGAESYGRAGSEMARDLLAKVRWVQECSGWVVMATATIMPNSIADLYAFLWYLEPELLRSMNLDSFHSWARQFGETRGVWSSDVDSRRVKLTQRFVRFHNLPELARLVGQCTEFHETGAEAEGIIPKARYHVEVIPQPPELKGYLDQIARRAERIHAGEVDPEEDNFFKLMNYAQLLAADLRLVDPEARPRRTKASACAQKAALLYWKNNFRKGTQLIFCSISTPKKGKFNLYDEIIRILTGLYGVPRGEIAYVQEESTPTRRQALFERVRRGEVRILLGSTRTLGSGVNVQDRLVAIHEVDVPWTPAELTQQEGRGLRPGNLWPEEGIDIFRYVAQGTFDLYKWDTVERKRRIQSQPLNSAALQRWTEEVDGGMDFGEIRALAAGDGRLKELVDLENQLRRLQILSAKERELCREMEEKIYHHPARMKEQDQLISRLTQDTRRYRNHRRVLSPEEREQKGRHILVWDGQQPTRYQSFDLEEGGGGVRYLKGAGRYPFHIYPDDTGGAVVARMDRTLGSLNKRLKQACGQRAQMEQDLAGWKEELTRLRGSDTAARAEEVTQQVEELRKELERRNDDG